MKTLKCLLSILIVICMLFSSVSETVYAFNAKREPIVSIINSSGQVIEADDSWIETFPYGTFAFSVGETAVEEGESTKLITVYRLGGTSGRAEAFITYVPAVSEIEEGVASYANAAGTADVIIEVEDPLPISAYQALGKDPAPVRPEPPVQVNSEENDSDMILTAEVEAASYQWYVKDSEEWKIVNEANEQTLVVSLEYFNEYDFRCVYESDETSYCTDSAKGKPYEEPDPEILPALPEEGVDMNPETTYSLLPMDGGEFEGYVFQMVFADGEWVKQIRVTAIDDDISEADEFGMLTIIGCNGASLYDTANTMTLHVKDNEAALPSSILFSVSEIVVNKAEGAAEVTVQREGSTEYVVSVDYDTIEGTAREGIDYAKTSGTLVFYTDIRELTISVPLINDGVMSNDLKSFNIKLSNLIGGGSNGVTSITNDTVIVYLHNLNNTTERNFATVLANTGEVDSSAMVWESGEALVSAPNAITAEEVLDKGDTIFATYQATPVVQGEIMPMTYIYPAGALTFDGNRVNYPGENWRDWAYVGNEFGYYSYYDVNDAEGYVSNYKSAWGNNSRIYAYGEGDEHGVQYLNKSSGASYLNLPYMAEKYSSFSGSLRWRARLASAWSLFWYGLEYTYPLFNINTDPYYIEKCEVTNKSSGTTYRISYTTSDYAYTSWPIDSPVTRLALYTQRYDAHDADSNAMAALPDGVLQRRYFSNNSLDLRIFTANDDDSPDPISKFSESTGVYDNLRPDISIETGKGGVTAQGQLYVGSVLQVRLKSTDSYHPATADENLNCVVYLTNSADEVVSVGEGNYDDFYLPLVWDGMTNESLSDMYTVNVIMTRKQDIELDISPSVPRTGTTGSYTIDTSKTEQAAADFWAGTTGITYGYHLTTSDEDDKFEYHATGMITQEMFSEVNIETAIMSLTEIENLQWVNFNQPEEDLILFNGRAYAGNERITLSVSDLAAGKITFRYYDKEFINALNVMTTSIASTALFIDTNGNGRIDGYFNEETGYFVLTEVNSVKDELVTYLDGIDYEESYFAPVYSETLGRYVQQFIKVFYTMTPKSLVPPVGAGEEDVAQVLPALVSNITDPETYKLLSREMKSYRYIISGEGRAYENNLVTPDDGDYDYTSDNHLMYTSAASAMSVVCFPLGGDYSPPELTGEIYTWQPEYHGNVLYKFSDPEPIYIEHSLAGDNIPIALVIGTDTSGRIIYESGGVEKLNEYLGSITGNDTFALCVREQTQSTGSIIANQDEVIVSVSAGDNPGFDSSGKGLVGTYPSSDYLKVMASGGSTPDADFDMNDSNNEYGEFGVDFGIELPDFEIPVTENVTIVMDGYEVGFTIGVPLGNVEKDLSDDKDKKLTDKESMDKLRKFMDGDIEDMIIDEGYLPDELSKLKSSSFEADFTIALAFMFKYNTLDNSYHFSEFAVSLTAELSFRYQYRFTPVPIVYVYVAVGLNVTLTTGLSVEREVVEDTDNPVDTAGFTGEKGSSITFTTDLKAFNIYFTGKLLIEATDIHGNPLPDVTNGFIKSLGTEPVTVVLVQQDGYTLYEPINVKLTAVAESSVSKVLPVTSAESNTYWNGFELAPEIWLEAGAGVGIEMMKFEIFVKVSISANLVFGAYQGKDAQGNAIYDPFEMDEFKFQLGLGFRVVFLMFSYEMDLIQYYVKYSGETDSWSHGWSALGGMYGEEEVLAMAVATSENGSEVSVRPPSGTAGTQRIYSPAGSGEITVMAYDPTDESVPFQLSGYASSGDASKLVDGLVTGYDYKIVTVGEDNYIIFTISRTSAVNAIDYSMLVMSRLKMSSLESGDSYGLVNPVNETSLIPYIVLDDDGTGDLEFSAWADENIIHAVWISYASVSEAAPFQPIVPGSEIPTAIDNPATPGDETGIEMNEFNFMDTNLFPEPPAPGAEPVEPTAPIETDYFLSVNTDPDNPVYTPVPPYSTYEEAKAAYDDAVVQYNDEYALYLIELQAYNAGVALYNTYFEWYTYFEMLTDYNSYVQGLAAVAARNTVVKTASFTVEDSDTNGINDHTSFSSAETVTTIIGSNVFLPDGDGDADLIFNAGTIHYEESELIIENQNYSDYLEAVFGEGSSFTEYRMRYQKGLNDVYGKQSSLNISAGGTGNRTTASVQLLPGVYIENAEITHHSSDSGTDTYYLAYTTGERYYVDGSGVTISKGFDENSDCARIIRFYLRKITVAQDGTPIFGPAYLVRTMVNYDMNNSKDGIYAGSSLASAYEDPYIANMQFLTGEIEGTTGIETFLLFEMNGNSYIIQENDISSIINGGPGEMTRFFTRESPNGATGKTEVTIGADGEGNITAVYTATVENTTNNALFVTKYNSETGSWGKGQMLAMNHMQVYEDSISEGWEDKETEEAYLGKRDGYEEGGMNQFTFSNIAIALGRKAEEPVALMAGASEEPEVMTETVVSQDAAMEENGSGSTLMIVTAGTFMELKDSVFMVNGEVREAVTADGEGSVGFYALSFGVGDQSIGEVELVFEEYDFVVNSELSSYITFKNTGDIAIRGSVSEPINIELWISPDGITSGYKIDSWTVSENILVGQKVNLSGTADKLTETLPYGSVFYLVVYEDLTYTTDGFNFSTLPDGGNLTVMERAELGYEHLKVKTLSVENDGNSVLSVNFQVGNRGTKTAEDVYVQISYQAGIDSSGKPVYLPVDLNNHNLIISAQEPLVMMMAFSESMELSNGILKLWGSDGSDDIDINNGRTVTGTLEIPSHYYYNAGITGSLNLKFEIFSNDDIITGFTNGIYIADHNEYMTFNNEKVIQIEHTTFFDTSDKVAIALGSSLRLPAGAYTTTGKRPVITVTEMLNDNTGTEEKHMGILYYNMEGSFIVITPSSEGSGFIRIADTATNSFKDIAYTVTSEGDGINIFNDNSMFTFYNSDGTIYDSMLPGQDWNFISNIPEWGTGGTLSEPYLYDLSTCAIGAEVKFDSVASSVDLFFTGMVEVDSTFPGFDKQTINNSGGSSFVNVEFGNNNAYYTHEVTLTAVSSDVSYDRYIETYWGAAPTPSDDELSPKVFWSRSFPETASVKTGTESIEVTCYIIDETGLALVNMNGKEPDGLIKESDGFWKFSISEDDNYIYQLRAVDTAGNMTNRTIIIDWFNAIVSSGSNPNAPDLNVWLEDQNGDLLLPGDNHLGQEYDIFINFESSSPDSVVVKTDVEYFVIEDSAFAALDMDNLKYPVNDNGYYMVKVTDANGKWRSEILNMDRIDTEIPIVELWENPESSSLTDTGCILTYSITKESHISPISILQLNGIDVPYVANQTMLMDNITVDFSGEYTLYTSDTAGNYGSDSVIVEDVPIFFDAPNVFTVTSSWNREKDTGAIWINENAVKGGLYVESSLSATKIYEGNYEYALVEYDRAYTGDKASNAAIRFYNGLDWLTVPGFENIAPGDYIIYVRDAQEPENISVIASSDKIHVNDITVSYKADFKIASSSSSKDGEIFITASEGLSGSGRYEFSLTPIHRLAELTPVNEITEWVHEEDYQGLELNWYRFAGLHSGTYQLSIRDAALDYSNPDNYENAVNEKIYLDYKGSGSGGILPFINVSDFDYSSEGYVFITFGTFKQILSSSAILKLISDNETRVIILSGNGRHVIVPVGTLQEEDDINQLLVDVKGEGNVVVYSDSSGGVHIVSWSIIDGEIVYYIVHSTGKYEIGDVVSPFNDTDGHWAAAMIDFAFSHKLFMGTGDDTFDPEGTMTRGMFVTVLGRLHGIDESLYKGGSFKDIEEESWYGAYTNWAADTGIANGYNDYTFRPDEPITREQMCVMLMRYLDYSGINLQIANDPKTFADHGIISPYAIEAVEFMQMTGLITGMENNIFNPGGHATRAQVATIFYRLIEAACKRFSQ